MNFAAAGIGSAAYVETVMLTSALKLPIKMLTGYNGNDDMLAMRRGEVVGTISLALHLGTVRAERLRHASSPRSAATEGRAAACDLVTDPERQVRSSR